MRFVLDQKPLEQVMSYLVTRPYQEVQPIINILLGLPIIAEPETVGDAGREEGNFDKDGVEYKPCKHTTPLDSGEKS